MPPSQAARSNQGALGPHQSLDHFSDGLAMHVMLRLLIWPLAKPTLWVAAVSVGAIYALLLVSVNMSAVKCVKRPIRSRGGR